MSEVDRNPADVEEVEETRAEDAAVLVRVLKEAPEKTAPADKASFRTITLAGNEAPQRFLAHDNRRHRALIAVHNPLGVAAPAVAPYVFIGTKDQIYANGDARGAAYVAGDLFETHAAAEQWIMPTGSAVSVTVQEERNL